MIYTNVCYQSDAHIIDYQKVPTTCFRSGGDRNTPKNATEHDQPNPAIQERWIGALPSFSSSSMPSAGMIPTKPAANGI